MDAMLGIFYEESSTLVEELRDTILHNRGKSYYSHDVVLEIFRGVHTLKADSTMMLFDGISFLSKKFECLLYCFRNGPKVIKDTERFDSVFYDYIDYVEQELIKIPLGQSMNKAPEYIQKEIDDYISVLSGEHEINRTVSSNADTNKSNVSRQVYYIPGTPEDNGNKTENIMTKQPKKAQRTYKSKSDTSVMLIKQKDMDSLRASVERYSNLISKYKDEEQISLSGEDLKTLYKINAELVEVCDKFTKGDFTTVSRKMEILVDEMSENLNKNVKLLVKGEKTMIDKNKRDKISGALIHLIRNAVDHGIESLDEREVMGKSPMGMIRLEFSDDNGHVKVSVEDDGAGVDRQQVLDIAKEKKILKKAPEEYSDEEIMELLLISGVSTTETPNDYSGRGVGMDVINHNVREIGGELTISSEEGYGTKVVMEF